jgi:hypothetical protein
MNWQQQLGVNGESPRDDRDLNPLERRIASMRAAGATIDSIALTVERESATIRNILLRPRVARFVMIVAGMVGADIADSVKDLNAAIENTAKEAWQTEVRNMRELDELGIAYDEPKHKIRAKLGAITTAQDILDRAGKRAPTKIQNTNFNVSIPPQAMERLTDVLEELVEANKQTQAEPDNGNSSRAVIIINPTENGG